MAAKDSCYPLLVFGVILFLAWCLFQPSQCSLYNKSRPVSGVRSEVFGWVRASLRSVKHLSEWTRTGYHQYSRLNMPFIVPMLDQGPSVILPRQQLKEVYGLPEEILDVHNTQNEAILIRWTVPDEFIHSNPLHIDILRNQLTQNIPRLTTRVAGEIQHGFEREWGHSSDWKEVSVWTLTIRIISNAANGAFLGQPLCRDIEFLDRMTQHAMFMFGGAISVGMLPKTLQDWVAGPLLSVTMRFMSARVFRKSRPIVKDRLEKTATLKADPGYDWTPPDDALQWLIEECYASPNVEAQLSCDRICYRVLIMNDVSLLTTAYTCQNFLLDLFSTDPAFEFVEALREECFRAFKESGYVWDDEAVKKLQLVDSAIRESMRLNPFGSALMPRKVAHPDGIKLKGWETPIPQGARIRLPVEAIHLDESIYSEASTFKPFRFIKSGEDGLFKVKSTVTLDDSFLSFGAPGRNACPGRFFALLEVKLFVANVLMNYEVDYLEKRPDPIKMMWANYPSDAKIRVRKKVSTC